SETAVKPTSSPCVTVNRNRGTTIVRTRARRSSVSFSSSSSPSGTIRTIGAGCRASPPERRVHLGGTRTRRDVARSFRICTFDCALLRGILRLRGRGFGRRRPPNRLPLLFGTIHRRNPLFEFDLEEDVADKPQRLLLRRVVGRLDDEGMLGVVAGK